MDICKCTFPVRLSLHPTVLDSQVRLGVTGALLKGTTAGQEVNWDLSK